MANGFEVDLSALRNASEGVNDVLGDLAGKKVSDLAPSSSAFGHEGLASTVADFCSRWERGVENLAKDGQEIAARLSYCVLVYDHAERANTASAQSILAGPGPDPAAP